MRVYDFEIQLILHNFLLIHFHYQLKLIHHLV
nr:MAG TPA: hypothetical protein [Caudoviricetes sp.]